MLGSVRRRRELLACVASAAAAGVATAQEPAFQEAVPPPEWARSVEVIDDGAVARLVPREGADRRGTVAAGTRLRLLRRVGGRGCPTGYWVQVADDAWICESHLRPSREPPGGTPLPEVREGRLLPSSHAFVAFDGTRAFAHPSDYMADMYVEAYGEGFGLVVTGHQVYAGVPFARTRRGLWVPRESLRFVRGSDFAGVALEDGDPLDLAWVLPRSAPVWSQPGGSVARRAGRREVVHVEEEIRSGIVRLTDGTFMRTRHLARATSAGRPDGVGEGERWIDVDVDEQVMVAWEGDRPVYATLVSTGRGRRTHATPIGEFRIWVKLAESDMDDLERTDVESNYMIEGVPWVQYFEGSNGFHAAFWHDDFGRRRSHGCVNLAPRDAEWLFDFTEPALPAGWLAVLPTDADPGTLVRVR